MKVIENLGEFKEVTLRRNFWVLNGNFIKLG